MDESRRSANCNKAQASGAHAIGSWNQAKHWRNRRSEIIEIGRERDFEQSIMSIQQSANAYEAAREEIISRNRKRMRELLP